jgi:hypothetical protein
MQVELEVLRLVKKLLEHDASLDPRERGPDAVVDAAPEREMVAGSRAVEHDVVGEYVLGGVAIRGAPQQ